MPLFAVPRLVQQYQVQVQVLVRVQERTNHGHPLSLHIYRYKVVHVYKKYTPGTIYIIDPGIVVLFYRITDVTTYSTMYFKYDHLRSEQLRSGIKIWILIFLN